MSHKNVIKRNNTMRKKFAVSEKITFSKMMLKMPADALADRRSHLKREYGFTIEEQRYIARQKPNFLLYDKDSTRGIAALTALLVGKYDFSQEIVRTLVLKYPTVLGKTTGQLEYFFDSLNGKQKIDHVTAMRLVFEVPILLNVDVVSKAKEIEELFQVYHKISAEEVTEIFKVFPYLYCCPSEKIQVFLAHFRKYKLTKQQILDLVSYLPPTSLTKCYFYQSMKTGGLLGCKPKNFTGLFDYLKWKHNIGAREVISILDNYPEFALQNRQELIQKKFRLIHKSNPNLSPIFIRNLFRRHPDMFLKSYASMEAKVNYLKRNLNRQL